MGILTFEQFADLYDPRFGEVLEEMEGVGERDMIPMFYTDKSTELYTERGTAITPMGQFQSFDDLGKVTYDAPSQGYDWQTSMRAYALGIQIERKLWEHDLFDEISDQWRQLIKSARETKQRQAALIFNEGFSVSSLLGAFTHSRNEALFADTHASTRAAANMTGGNDNLYVGALSRTAINSIRVQARKWKDDAGFVQGMKLDHVVIPPDLEPDFREQFEGAMAVDDHENLKNINADLTYTVWDLLTDTNDYFVINKAAFKRLCYWYDFVDVEYRRVLDFETFVAKWSGYYKGASAWRDWRLGIGAQVS